MAETPALDWEALFTNYERAVGVLERLESDLIYAAAKSAHAVAWTALLTALRAEPSGIVWKGQRYAAGQMPGGHAAAIHSRALRRGELDGPDSAP